MARGKTLAECLTGLRVELRASLNPANNTQVRDTHIKKLQSTQEWLYEDYSWPHLRVERFIRPVDGQRFYDLTGCKKLDVTNTLVAAGDLNIDRVEKIELRDGTTWLPPLRPGIDPYRDFNAFDSDVGETAWPIERWQIAEDEQVELWPIPSLTGDETTLDNMAKVTGTRNLARWTEDADTADLDDRIIILFAAADLEPNPETAKKKLSLANKRLLDVRGNLTVRRKFRMFGAVGRDERVLRGPPRVYYRTT